MNFPEIVDLALPVEGVFHNLVFGGVAHASRLSVSASRRNPRSPWMCPARRRPPRASRVRVRVSRPNFCQTLFPDFRVRKSLSDDVFGATPKTTRRRGVPPDHAIASVSDFGVRARTPAGKSSIRRTRNSALARGVPLARSKFSPAHLPRPVNPQVNSLQILCLLERGMMIRRVPRRLQLDERPP